MKVTVCIIGLVLWCNYLLYAQSHDNIWLVGQETTSSTVLDFSSGNMQVDSASRNMPIYRTATSVSDSFGNLIFYTNGIQINNANYQLMQNGDSLNPGQVANDYSNIGYTIFNGVISIPHPVQANKYYLFHQSNTYASDIAGLGEHLYYSLIDMNANNGLGIVEKKNQVLVSDSIANGQLQAVKHANGRDWWLLQPMAWSNGFYTFLVTSNAIELVHNQYIGNANRNGNEVWLGQSVFSPDGSKYARYDHENDLDIFDFDRCTGLLSNPIHIPIQDTIDNFGGTYTGIAISPSSQYLYVSSYHILFQFDLWAGNVVATKDTAAVHDGFSSFGVPSVFRFMQLAPDNKIYILADPYYFHTIENPDSAGISSNVLQRNITVPYYLQPFLPNHPHYRTPVLAGSLCDTLTNSIAIEQAKQQDIWLYPNPASTSISIEAAQSIERVVVYNALGQQVMSVPGKEQLLLELETSNLENGSYFVSIWLADKVVTKQLQVLR
jgi:hypothetical protein